MNLGPLPTNLMEQASRHPHWIDLRSHGRLWGRYCPELRRLELAKGNVRAVFHLDDFRDTLAGSEAER